MRGAVAYSSIQSLSKQCHQGLYSILISLLQGVLVTETLRNSLKGLGLSGHYSGHSFRRGAATSAREAGLSDDEIQFLGRWKSDSYKLYIDSSPQYILNASRRHQKAPSRA